MTAAERKLKNAQTIYAVKTEILKRQVRIQPEPIQSDYEDAAIISEKVKQSSCFSMTLMGLILLAVAAWGFIAAVLS